ncbi:MAG: transcriptional repressor [Candidatus Taylorbacteria bacterium]|nr:transcriptional repressor [Candidatus Taylorbacteria bacterium]
MKRLKPSDRYAAILREKGEKATKARIGLLVALERERFPISIKELGTKVKAPDPSTLYRSLKALAEKGLVREIMTDKKEARYEIAIGRAHHHHVVCTSCGLMKDVRVCPEKAIAPASLGFSKITGHTLEFFGICKSCA